MTPSARKGSASAPRIDVGTSEELRKPNGVVTVTAPSVPMALAWLRYSPASS
jgi:hypothetical protein